tara:strand:- start:120 stop:1046 length:927 start_codon:yes stop_codon:yes gene_type:complete
MQTVLSEYFGRPIDPAKFDTLFGEMSRKDKTIRRALEEAVKHASALAPDQDELDRMLEEARCEGVLLRKTAERFRSGRSWLMGAPTLPINVAWPTATLPGGETVTLDFVAQLDLGHVPSGGKLPATGVLFFFVDLNSPLDDTDREARVIHVASVPETCPIRVNESAPARSEAVSIRFEPVVGYNSDLFRNQTFERAAMGLTAPVSARFRETRHEVVYEDSRGLVSRVLGRKKVEIRQYLHTLFMGPDFGRWQDFDDSDRVPLLTLDTEDRDDLSLPDDILHGWPLTFAIQEPALFAHDFDDVKALLRE